MADTDEHSHSGSLLQESFRQRQLIGVILDPEGRYIDHVYREPSNTLLMVDPPIPSPDKVYKERYIPIADEQVNTYRFILEKIIPGEHSPGYFVPEQINFNQ